ncbi:hypothetical protein BDR06DRAFT_924808 [Suillus hirtellus]|nr:hypothetical protein BDR06DRAFT_924808 [Suillus hirtellus]
MESTLLAPYFCPPFLCIPLSGASSSTSTPLYSQAKPINVTLASRFSLPPDPISGQTTLSEPSPISSSNDKEKNSTKRHKLTYKVDLTPVISALWPHCVAKDRLHLWIPFAPRLTPNTLEAGDIVRIQEVMLHAWAESTRESYGSGLLVFHVFCDLRAIPERDRAPADSILISTFIAAAAGLYSGKTIANYVFGVRAWHILHGQRWILNDEEIDALLKASKNLTPPSSKCKKRRPYTIEFICTLQSHLDPECPLDVAIFNCLTTAFFCTARVREFTVPSLTSFNPNRHVKPSNVRIEHNRNNLSMRVFHLPQTKTSITDGEDVSFAKQDGPSDPERAFLQHIAINNPPPGAALFAYCYKNGHRPLTKQKFITRLAVAARAAGMDPLQGHGIRIGSTLEYLL